MRARAFAADLERWYKRHHRNLPWRATQDPYRIWLAEVMLQQTRAAAVIPYYYRFLERFPTVESLAAASEGAVLERWSGLGYYSRATNLHQAAKAIAEKGDFPRDYDSIRKLPGVGDYTAAAVASIAFDLPYPVLDGNVMRVIARLSNDSADIGSPQTKARFLEIVTCLLDRKNPGCFNQAMMELGATICLPRAPKCLLCPVAAHCEARGQGTASALPLKLRKSFPVSIHCTLLWIERHGRILLWQRDSGSPRMAGFWELPSREQLPKARAGAALGRFRHVITHHNYTFTLQSARLARPPYGFRWLDRQQLASTLLSTVTRKAIRIARPEVACE